MKMAQTHLDNVIHQSSSRSSISKSSNNNNNQTMKLSSKRTSLDRFLDKGRDSNLDGVPAPNTDNSKRRERSSRNFRTRSLCSAGTAVTLPSHTTATSVPSGSTATTTTTTPGAATGIAAATVVSTTSALQPFPQRPLTARAKSTKFGAGDGFMQKYPSSAPVSYGSPRSRSLGSLLPLNRLKNLKSLSIPSIQEPSSLSFVSPSSTEEVNNNNNTTSKLKDFDELDNMLKNSTFTKSSGKLNTSSEFGTAGPLLPPGRKRESFSKLSSTLPSIPASPIIAALDSMTASMSSPISSNCDSASSNTSPRNSPRSTRSSSRRILGTAPSRSGDGFMKQPAFQQQQKRRQLQGLPQCPMMMTQSKTKTPSSIQSVPPRRLSSSKRIQRATMAAAQSSSIRTQL